MFILRFLLPHLALNGINHGNPKNLAYKCLYETYIIHPIPNYQHLTYFALKLLIYLASSGPPKELKALSNAYTYPDIQPVSASSVRCEKGPICEIAAQKTSWE